MTKIYLIVFLSIMLISCAKEPKRIGIQPYGNINDKTIFDITETLQQTYQMDVIVLTERELPEHAFINIKSPRYRADSLLKDLIRQKPDSIDYVLGITARDISTTKRQPDGQIKQPVHTYQDWGIFGLAYRPGESCIVSTHRLAHKEPTIYLSRLQKVAVHEIGHNLGLAHCPTAKCVMQDAVESIQTVDQANLKLCDQCQQRI
ncbi:MAG: matrixin family metalloprotease [Algicola sp.]|nr:matrixin family metalloprotease [Algicola sp.]